LALAGLALAFALGTPFLLTLTGYIAIHLLYTLWLKHVAIVDMLVIAIGFVLRAVAGAVVIAVPVSPWLVLCAGLLALFLAAAKRRHEVVLLRELSGGHRPVLTSYSAELLDSFMVTLSAATITSYALYTFFEGGSLSHYMMLTIPFVIYGVLRYQLLVLSREKGGSPEEVLLGDVPILIDVALWAVAAVFVLYVLPHLL
jgi:4-hydroxybenzoate polyprenyltransferase